MPQILVRNLRTVVVRRLKARAKRHGRSLSAEVREILAEASAQASRQDFLAAAARMRRLLGGRSHSDSGVLQAEDRER